MASLKSLVKDTAVYGVSSIVGRLLNWLLVPMYTYALASTGEYGIVTNLYSYVAVVLIILTCGMETGFFRFTNHERWNNPGQVYTTTLMAVGAFSALFAVVVSLFSGSIAQALDYGDHPEYIWMMAVAVALDAVTSIPFAYLRYKKRPYRFATVKLMGIGLNIALNILFIKFIEANIMYIFLANVICSTVTVLLLLPEFRAERYSFNGTLLKEMLRYSLPLLVLGIAGVMNQTVDKILLPWLVADHEDAMAQVGIYGACYKVAVIMVMFLQAFRFAYEPFVFARHREGGCSMEEKLGDYSRVMTWFTALGLLIFLVVMEFLPVLQYIIGPEYHSGLRVVPIIMLAELFFGIFFNLSIWYKLTDRTSWGSWFSLGGLAITVLGNVLLVPHMGYMGCAWAALACYGSMMVASYVLGRRVLPVPYRMGRIGFYALVAAVLYGLGTLVPEKPLGLRLGVGTLIVVAYIAVLWYKELRGVNLKRLIRKS